MNQQQLWTGRQIEWLAGNLNFRNRPHNVSKFFREPNQTSKSEHNRNKQTNSDQSTAFLKLKARKQKTKPGRRYRTFAPASSSFCTHSIFPCIAANINGVLKHSPQTTVRRVRLTKRLLKKQYNKNMKHLTCLCLFRRSGFTDRPSSMESSCKKKTQHG